MSEPISSRPTQVRRAWENAHPDLAAEIGATAFERAAIAIPPELVALPGAARWQAKAADDAADMFRDLAIAGTIALKDLGSTLGKDRRAAALKLLRGSGVVAESTETGLTIVSLR